MSSLIWAKVLPVLPVCLGLLCLDFPCLQATMESLLRREQKQKELRKMGAGEPGVRNKPWEQIYHEKDINELRADAPKMELRPDDHDALGLVCYTPPLPPSAPKAHATALPDGQRACHRVKRLAGQD